MEKRELVFVPAPGLGHVVSTVELAKRLIDRDPGRISVTVLNIKAPSAPQINAHIESLSSTFPDITFVNLPPVDPPPLAGVAIETFVSLFIENYKPSIKAAITQLISTESTRQLAGLVIDLFFTTLIDVGNDLGIPTYVYFTSNAALLGLMLHLPTLHTEFTPEFMDSKTELTIPSFANSVPPNVLPSALLNKCDDAYAWYLYHGRRFREAKGILVNTFAELEPYALGFFAADGRTPPVYPVGPLVDLVGKAQLRSGDKNQDRKIMEWLDGQPPSSVVLLCFGSMGGFNAAQVREIAVGLERSGHRFLWSLRNLPPIGADGPSVAENPREGLPEGFSAKGLVCDWVPQVEVLGHEAIGGFVTHCGWNSILESLWFGVPMVTWPMYAEQQLNALLMVRELGIAVELRMDYRMGGSSDVVTAEEVERGVRRVMEGESEVRRRVAEMRVQSRDAMMDGGSSFASLGRFIEDLTKDLTR